MKSVLLIAHGSSKTDQNEVFLQMIDMVRQLSNGQYNIEGAFMSFSNMDISTKLKELIDKGTTEIVIVPYLLFAGSHVKETIPQEVEKFMVGYPNVNVIYKDSLGVDKRLAEIILDRINQ